MFPPHVEEQRNAPDTGDDVFGETTVFKMMILLPKRMMCKTRQTFYKFLIFFVENDDLQNNTMIHEDVDFTQGIADVVEDEHYMAIVDDTTNQDNDKFEEYDFVMNNVVATIEVNDVATLNEVAFYPVVVCLSATTTLVILYN